MYVIFFVAYSLRVIQSSLSIQSLVLDKDMLQISWTILSNTERCNDVNPMWNTNPWDKVKPQHQELHVRALLFVIQ